MIDNDYVTTAGLYTKRFLGLAGCVASTIVYNSSPPVSGAEIEESEFTNNVLREFEVENFYDHLLKEGEVWHSTKNP